MFGAYVNGVMSLLLMLVNLDDQAGTYNIVNNGPVHVRTYPKCNICMIPKFLKIITFVKCNYASIKGYVYYMI